MSDLVHTGNGHIPAKVQDMMSRAVAGGQQVDVRLRQQRVLTAEGDMIETQEVYVWLNHAPGSGTVVSPLQSMIDMKQHLAELRNRLKNGTIT